MKHVRPLMTAAFVSFVGLVVLGGCGSASEEQGEDGETGEAVSATPDFEANCTTKGWRPYAYCSGGAVVTECIHKEDGKWHVRDIKTHFCNPNTQFCKANGVSGKCLPITPV
jgi:hypothetical protein